jgi:hypothetical protein
MIYALGALSGVVGFLAGMFGFKVKCRWCPECGATTLAHRPYGQAAGK